MGDYFFIEPDMIRSTAAQLSETGPIRDISQEILAAAENPAFHGEGRGDVIHALRALSARIGKAAENSENFAQSLEQILARYLQAEERVAQIESALQPPGTRQAAAAAGTASTSAQPANGQVQAPASASSSLGTSRRCSAYSSDPVNLCTGNLVWQDTDLGAGMPAMLRIRRTYNAMSDRSGWFGKGWQCEWETELVRSGENTYRLLHPDGRITEEKPGEMLELTGTETGGTEAGGTAARLRMPGGTLARFDAGGQLRSLRGPDGTALTLSPAREGGADSKEHSAWIIRQDNADRQIQLHFQDGLVREAVLFCRLDGEKEEKRVFFTYRQGADAKDWLLTKVLLEDQGEKAVCRQYSYNAQDLLERITGADGAWIVRNEYDKTGRAVRQVFPDGTSLAYRYYDSDYATELKERDGRKIVCEYDALLRKLCVRDGSRMVFYAYDKAGRQSEIYRGPQDGIRFAYDSANRLVRTWQQGETTRISYRGAIRTPAHMVSEGRDGKTHTDFIYDSAGNLRRAYLRSGICYDFVYDRKNRLTQVNREQKMLCQMAYDPGGRVSVLREADGSETKYKYSPSGVLTGLQDRNDLTWRFCMQPGTNRTKTLSRSDGAVWQYTYAADGGVRAVRAGNGEQFLAGRHVYAPEGYEAALDHAGRIMRLGSREKVIRWERDAQGRQVLEERSDGTKLGRSFENGGKLQWISVTVPGAPGRRISFRYAERGGQRLICAVKDDEYEVRFSWNEAGQLQEKLFPGGMKEQYAYTREGEILSVTHRKDDRILQTIRYTRDQRGRIRSRLIEKPGESTRESIYYYDSCNRLCAETTRIRPLHTESAAQTKSISYQYDPYGNRTSVEYTGEVALHDCKYYYDASGRLSLRTGKGGQARYTYDEKGNVTSIRSSEEERAFYYSDTGFLKGCEIRKTDCVGSTDRSKYESRAFILASAPKRHDTDGHKPSACTMYETDALGCRTGQEIMRGGQKLQIRNVYDTSVYPPRLIDRRIRCEETGDTQDMAYLWLHVPLLMHRGRDCFVYLTDGLGNISAVADPEGRIAEYAEGSAFAGACRYEGAVLCGKEVQEEMWNLLQPFVSCGYEKEPVSGLWHSHFREYDPSDGRFIMPDRCGDLTLLPVPANRYAWCFSDPVNFRDYDGRWPHLPSPAQIWNGIVDMGQGIADGASAAWSYLCGAEQTIYEINQGGVCYTVSDHTGGSVFVSNYDQYGNYTGWGINATFKIPFTDISLKASLSGEDMNPLNWGFSQGIKFGQSNGETSGYTSYKMTVDGNGISWKAETGGDYDSMPIPLPNGETWDSETELSWAASVKSGGISWYQFATAIACAGAAAAVVALVLDDGTGLGVLDDTIIPVLGGFLAEYGIVLGDAIPALAFAGCGG